MDGQSLQPRSHRRPEPRTPGRRLTKDHGSHVLDHLNVLYKYRHVAISVFLLVVLGVLLRTYTTVPLYRAQARLMIELEDERTAAIAGAINTVGNNYWQDPQVYYETQYRILTGRELGRRVVHRLDLGKVAEFNGAGPAPTGINRIVSTVKDAVASPFRKAPAKLPPPPAADSDAVESAMVGALLSRVGVDPVQNSRLVDVTFVSAEPAFAARAINALADEYVQQNLELRRQNMVTSLEWLSQELVKQQQKVEDSERAMAQYREDQNALSLEDRQNIVVSRLNQLNDAVTKAKTNRVQKQSLYDQVRNLSPDAAPDTIPAILQNPYIQTIKTRLAELQREKATMLERYGEKYPDVMKVSASLEDVKVQLQTELKKAIAAIQNDYESARAEERALAGSLEEQKNAAMDLNRKSVSYTVLERDANSNRQVYETLLQREKELQVMANSRGNNVRITDRAEQPVAPFTPAPGRELMLALIAGVSLALGLVFVLDYLNDTVKTPDDVTEKLRIPLLGLAPKVRGRPGRPAFSGCSARVRRGVSVVAHVAHLQHRIRGDASRHGDERTAARRQDHDVLQPGAGARYRRRPRAAHRRRHAPARRAPHPGPREQRRVVAGLDRTGDADKRDPHRRYAEAHGADGRDATAESVRAAGLGAHERAPS